MGTTRSAVVGAFVAGGLILFAVGLFLIGDRRLLFSPRFEVSTTFTKVSGLQVGTKVRVAGMDAGEVLDVGIPGRPSEPFRVRMRLREDLRPLVRSDSICTIQTDGIVGSAFIQVGRGSDAAPLVEPGSVLTGRDPVEFADLIAEGRATFQAVAEEITGLGAELSEVVDGLTAMTTTTNTLIEDVGTDLTAITEASVGLVEDGRQLLQQANAIATTLQTGDGSIARLLNDDALYQRWVGLSSEAEATVRGLRAATDRAREMVEGLASDDGTATQIVQSLQGTLNDTREVMSDLSESTEALKRNFLFRGFFRDRGFYDLDALSREAYVAGALAGEDRTALRVWVDAAGLFESTPDGREQLSEAGRRRLDATMSDFVRYPRDSPLVVEGYADASEGGVAFLVSADRAQLVRDYLLTRFRREVRLTGVMPMATEALGSPRGDDRWAGVALTLFVRNDALGSGG